MLGVCYFRLYALLCDFKHCFGVIINYTGPSPNHQQPELTMSASDKSHQLMMTLSLPVH